MVERVGNGGIDLDEGNVGRLEVNGGTEEGQEPVKGETPTKEAFLEKGITQSTGGSGLGSGALVEEVLQMPDGSKVDQPLETTELFEMEKLLSLGANGPGLNDIVSSEIDSWFD